MKEEKQEFERQCKNCEYYDIHYNDCHNRNSPRFNPPPEYSCNQFYLSTTIHDQDIWEMRGWPDD